MTTIAYKEGVMAGDSQITNGNLIHCGVNKVFRLNSCLLGIAGDARAIHRVSEWVRQKELEVDLDNCDPMRDMAEMEISGEMEFQLLLICFDKDEAVFMDQDVNPISLGFSADFMFALGTGQEIAMGAMHAGASAEEAVRIACLLDTDTGGEVCSVTM